FDFSSTHSRPLTHPLFPYTTLFRSLPIPKILKPLRKDKNEAYYEVEMTEFRHKMHRDLRPTRLWGYNGQFPGPIIDVSRGKPIQDRKSTRLNSSHVSISYAVFCLKK